MNKPAPTAAPEEPPAEGGEGKKRKRKSRWETDDSLALAVVPAGDGSNKAIVAVFPKDVILSNGLKV
jgi:hypothetical protein